MVDLIAKTPCAGLLPISEGALTLVETPVDSAVLVTAFKGQEKAIGAAVKKAVGVGLPRPGEDLRGDEGRALWVGPGQALVFGRLPEQPGAAVVDQSDAFACATLTGPGAETALARLVPLDLRATVFPVGRTARTLIGHMPASVTPVDEGFELMVMRSMAGTLVEEVHRAMSLVAARG